MDEDLVFTKRFLDCVRREAAERTEQDVEYICHTLKKLSEFTSYDNTSIRSVLERLVFEVHEKDTILYSIGDQANCWYYVLTGSVMLSMNYFFSTGSSFGRCINSDIRDDQCHVLEPSELLRINYTEDELKQFAQRAAKMASKNHLTSSTELAKSASFESLQTLKHESKTNGIGTVAASTRAEDTVIPAVQNHIRSESHRPPLENMVGVTIDKRSGWKRSSPSGDRPESMELDMIDPLKESTPPNDEGSHNYPLSADLLAERNRRSRSEERVFSFDPADMKKVSMSNSSLERAMEHPVKVTTRRETTSSEIRVRRRKTDRERRYSAPPSDKKGSAMNRDSVGSLDYLSESQVDSDDEESVQSESSSATSMDAVLEVLSKPPADRGDEDIERVMDVLQYMPVFSNMTSNIRRALFQLLMLSTVDSENTVVIDNGDEVDRWYVVLNGHLKLYRNGDVEKTFHIGDSFGVSPSLKVLPHRGRLVTAEKACTLCYVSSDDYGRIRIQGEENLKQVTEDGVLVAVLEKRAVAAKREGYFVVQATPEKLLDYLIEESVDDTFVKDFLLTYRTFLKSTTPIISKLKDTWLSGLPEQRERITMILLHWVSEHFPDFEGSEEMTSFLDWFEARLVEDGKVGEKRALDKARASNARTRQVEIDRAGTNSPLDFEVVGGWEVAHPIFISKVVPLSIPDKAGLRVADQILEINDAKCDKKELKDVLSVLRKNYKLSLKVKSNYPEFKQYMADPPKPPPDYHKGKSPGPLPIIPSHSAISRCNSVDTRPATADAIKGKSKVPSSPKAKKKVPKIIRPLSSIGGKSLDKLRKLRLGGTRHSSLASLGDSTDTITPSGGPLKAKMTTMSRKKSAENLLESEKPSAPLRASSLEDIHTLSTQNSSRSSGLAKIVDAVVKLYQPDHSHKYLDISPNTTIAELIQRGVKEFYPDKFVVSPSDEYCICMVSVTSRNGPIRNSVLPNHLSDLANNIGLESRYYLKERAFHGTLVQDDESEHIFKESRQWELIMNLSPKQVAEELTRQDSEVFCSIDASEYISDLWRDPDHLTKENLAKFENIPNDEMYWVVTMVVSEMRAEVRAKLVKHFIKIAKWCKELKNFNSMFHILSGLNHGLVQRQRSAWDKVPSKYRKAIEDLTSYMNPFHNMAKYRELQRTAIVPLIPFFPIIKKDLTFLYDGNETQVGGLVNFEKLRMLAKQIRVIKTYCQQPMMPEPPQIDLGRLGGVLKSIHHSIRLRNRHNPMALSTITDNALKEVYYHHRMTKMVRKHLSRKYVVQEEDLLEKIAESSEKVVQLRRNPPSPLNRGKRKSAPHTTQLEKQKSTNFSISPSPTTGSFGSDSSAPVAGDQLLATPPISPRKLSAPALSSLASSDSSSIQNTSTPPRSPTHLTLVSDSNGSAIVRSMTQV